MDCSTYRVSLLSQTIIATLAQFKYNAEMDYVVPRTLIDQLRYNDNTSNPVRVPLYSSHDI